MKNMKLAAIAGVAAVALVGGTFAYFTQTSTIENPFNTASYRTTVTEDFNPADGDKWEPGVEVNKDLYVNNSGDRPVVVRVKLEENWSRKDENGMDVVFKPNDRYVTTDPVKQPEASEEFTDGKTETDGTVVEKFFENTDLWSERQPDGWYYFKTTLAPKGEEGSSTGKFLDKVKLIDNVDMGKYRTHIYWKTGPKGVDPQFDPDNLAGWTEYTSADANAPIEGVKATVTALRPEQVGVSNEELQKNNESIYTALSTVVDSDALGYSNANYVLTITVDTVQATDEAVTGAFGAPGAGTYSQELFTGWKLDKEALETETAGE